MGQKRSTGSESSNVPSAATTLAILGTLANTTWRMFAPVLILLVAGMVADDRYQTEPLWSLVGTIGGFAIAIWLVYRQYTALTRQDNAAKQDTNKHSTETT
ncbi:hypothetical protein CR970_02800 [Candidatus Saccharibacteria bacterium]|nr:MAG: hypothetical protein CR970_02800 [Candidatus Saccharibacteria bacterium]